MDVARNLWGFSVGMLGAVLLACITYHIWSRRTDEKLITISEIGLVIMVILSFSMGIACL